MRGRGGRCSSFLEHDILGVSLSKTPSDSVNLRGPDLHQNTRKNEGVNFVNWTSTESKNYYRGNKK